MKASRPNSTLRKEKLPTRDLPNFDLTLGDSRLSAWATSESTCRIQTRDARIAKRLAKLPDAEPFGTSVVGGYLRIFAMPYTLPWVGKNVIDRITLEFHKKHEGINPELPLRARENQSLHLGAVGA